MARVVDDVHVIGALLGDLQIAERLLRVHVLERDHVDRADQLPLMVVGEKRPGRERRGIDVEGPEPGNEIGKRNELTDRLYAPPGGALRLGRRSIGGCAAASRHQAPARAVSTMTFHACISV